MTLKNLIIRTRSYRRFFEEVPIPVETLTGLVDLARLTASAKNMQPLKYIISASRSMNEKVFETLAWAGYLPKWKGPEKGERPTGYIIVIRDNTIAQNNYCDHGLATQSIMLGATEKGFGGCVIAAIDKPKLSALLNLSENLEILLVLSLGKPKENVILDILEKDGDHRYWRDENNNQHVPKRKLEDIILRTFN